MKRKIVLGVIVGGFCSMVAMEQAVEPTRSECYMQTVKRDLGETVAMLKCNGRLERHLLQRLTGERTGRLSSASLRSIMQECYAVDSKLLDMNKELRAHIVKLWATEDAGGDIQNAWCEIEHNLYNQLLKIYSLEDSVYQLCRSVDRDFMSGIYCAEVCHE